MVFLVVQYIVKYKIMWNGTLQKIEYETNEKHDTGQQLNSLINLNLFETLAALITFENTSLEKNKFFSSINVV